LQWAFWSVFNFVCFSVSFTLLAVQKKAEKNLQLFKIKQRPYKKVKKTERLFEKMKTLLN
jgi:hypothetical protein